MSPLALIAICVVVFVFVVATGPRSHCDDKTKSFVGFVIEMLTQWWW